MNVGRYFYIRSFSPSYVNVIYRKLYKFLSRKVDFEVPDIEELKSLDKDKKIILIRTIQECLNNAIKHANPQAISFHMATNKDQFVIYMRDDGVGFDTSEDSSGSGMYNLKNRMTAIGGVFEIESEPGNGTEIKLSLPISNP